MKAPSPPRMRVVLYEGPGATPLEDERRFELVSALLEAGYPLTRPASGGSVAPQDDTPLVVLGSFEGGRTPTFNSTSVHVHDVAEQDAAAIVNRVAELRADADLPEPGAWTPWFPVIDYERCTNCMQCLSFCLFDVYGVDQAGGIQVQNNDNCKTGCPACSRRYRPS